MNYQKIYDSIIDNAKFKNRKKYDGIYYEKHHILPKCLGGDNLKNNIVLLTAKEHYVCHKLLIKIHPQNKGLIYAFNRLSHDKISGRNISSRDYQYLKELFNSMELKFSEEHKQKMSKARKGKSYEEFYKDKASYMKKQRKLQCSGSGNPNARKYIIFNSNLNKSWFCHGNLDKFCFSFHVSGRTFQKSRNSNSYINGWKCEEYDSSNPNHQKYEVFLSE